jgi:hypothetical protein
MKRGKSEKGQKKNGCATLGGGRDRSFWLGSIFWAEKDDFGVIITPVTAG